VKWNGFNIYFFLDRIYRISGILFACGEVPTAGGDARGTYGYYLQLQLLTKKGGAK
jgi:hypothetical protein